MAVATLPLTGLPIGAVSPAVLVCGDPARATRAAGFLEQATLLSDRREYRAFSGLFMKTPVVVCSHGIGAPGAAIAFEELVAAGARHLIRAGTCGSLQPYLHAGDLVIAAGAVDSTGYGRETVPPGYPAVASPALVLALEQAATEAAYLFTTGIVLSRDNFYRGVVTTVDYPMYSQANVLAVEMECAALFHVANLRGVRAAAILAVDGNVLESGGEDFDNYDPHQEVVATAVEAEILIALDALHRLARQVGDG
jgi:uridine phosphorylase